LRLDTWTRISHVGQERAKNVAKQNTLIHKNQPNINLTLENDINKEFV